MYSTVLTHDVFLFDLQNYSSFELVNSRYVEKLYAFLKFLYNWRKIAVENRAYENRARFASRCRRLCHAWLKSGIWYTIWHLKHELGVTETEE